MIDLLINCVFLIHAVAWNELINIIWIVYFRLGKRNQVVLILFEA